MDKIYGFSSDKKEVEKRPYSTFWSLRSVWEKVHFSRGKLFGEGGACLFSNDDFPGIQVFSAFLNG